jgi:hypothetical protein
MDSQPKDCQRRTTGINRRALGVWQRLSDLLRVHNYVVLSKKSTVYNVPYVTIDRSTSVGAMHEFTAGDKPNWCHHFVYVIWGSLMLMSRAFPKIGRRRGPGGSGRLVSLLFDQMDSKAIRDTAPMAIRTVLTMTKDHGHHSLFNHALCCSKVWRDGNFKLQTPAQPEKSGIILHIWMARYVALWYHPKSRNFGGR